MMDLTIDPVGLEHAVQRARERNLILPTFAQMQNPDLIPPEIKEELRNIGLWEVHPRNLFRITWHNEPTPHGGGFGPVNMLEFSSELTGVPARILALVGKWFPTGAHKVGAAYGVLAPRLVTGQFDPTRHKAAWPSTGNYCRGGAFDSRLLGVHSIAILPEGMSQERFEWLANMADEVIKTPGTEANVKEIFDKCKELQAQDPDVVILNQFDDFGNYLWHFAVTGRAMEEVLDTHMRPGDVFRGLCLTTGSAGTIASGDYLKGLFPEMKVAAGEALQVPTLLMNGYGEHRIEGIGDKHVPWIHNVRNTDLVIDIDDEAVVRLARLFNEPVGRAYLVRQGVPQGLVQQLDLLGFSGIANLIMSIKFAKYFELGPQDVVLTVLTDSMELYQSRLREMREAYGEYTEQDAAADFARYLQGLTTDYVLELRYPDRKRIHNLKYFTWVEQQGKNVRELDAQWADPTYWKRIQDLVPEIDTLIEEFNARVRGASFV